MTFRLLVFDFDGTLAHTETSILRALDETMAALNYEPLDSEEIRRAIGFPLDKMLARLCPRQGEETLREIADYYRAIFDDIALEHSRLYPGVHKTLEQMRDAGTGMAVVSNRGLSSLVLLLRHLEIEEFFKPVVSSFELANPKPAPDALILVTEELGIAGKDTLVIGDTAIDVRFAKAASCRSCAVTYGYGDEAEIIEARPDYYISSFERLLDILTPTETPAD